MFISFIRTIILYIAVVVSLRFMGKRQIGQLRPSEIVIAMMISELASIPMENVGTPLVYGLIPTFTLIIAETTSSFLTLKSKRMRKFISGSPTIIIEKGVVLEEEMKKQRLDINDLMEELRNAGYPNIFDIDYAIMETNGLLSVIPKREKKPVSIEDMKLTTKDEGLPLIIVSDGSINYSALNLSKFDEGKLKKTLKKEYSAELNDVFIAVSDETGKLFVQKYSDGK